MQIDKMDAILTVFQNFLASKRHQEACRLAMEYSTVLLAIDSGKHRNYLYDNFFKKLDIGYRAQYQSYDFEIADYQMFSLSENSHQLFRGPRPPIGAFTSGNYFTVFGAAQLFGRFHRTSFCDRLTASIGMPFLNLSYGGAGPEFFSRNPDMIAAANRGRGLILQVLSGRSVGCEEYPGMRMTSRAGSNEPPMDRIELLNKLWATDRNEANRLVRKWQPNYLAAMQALMAQIKVPITLVWISDRRPSDWTASMILDRADFGSFPQLVDAEMVQTLSNKVHSYIELSPDPEPEFELTSRLSGKKCPFFWPEGTLGWVNKYYPSEKMQIELAARLAAPLRASIA